MAVNFTKANVKRMAEVLDGDYQTVEEAAQAALEAAADIYESRAKFTVVGQIKHPENKGDKFCLGLFVTENQATEEALKGTYSAQTHEEALLWILPVAHQSAAEYYRNRKTEARALEASEKSWRERELARRTKWVTENPGVPYPESWGVMPFREDDVQDCPNCGGIGKVKKHD